MAQYQLYCFAQSGNCYKAALTLELCGADWTPVWVDFFNGAARSPEYLALNPMGEAPVLVEGEGEGRTVLTQSGVMQFMLVDRFGKFGGETEDEKREVLRWVLWDNHKCSSQLGTWRFLTNFLPPEKRNADVIRFVAGRCKAALQVLEDHLSTRDWVAADRPTIADFACCSYLFFLDEVGEAEADWPNIAAWLNRIRALPGWKHPYDLMPGHPLPGAA